MKAFQKLGESTTDWKTFRLKRVVTLGASRTEDRSLGLQYLGMENIESWTGRRIETGTPIAQSKVENETGGLSNQFDVGDVLFGKLRPYLAKAHIAEEAGLCSTELLVLRTKPQLLNRYLLRLLLTSEVVTLVDSSTFGSKMPRADWDFIGNVELPIPPLATQRRIAAYLDRETTRIDALIAAKERLLELLAEKRRVLITHAVTRGLNPHARLKDSGLPWLGMVPEHWEVLPLKRMARVIDCKHRTVPFALNGVPLASIREVQSWNVDLSTAKMTTEEEYEIMIEGERDPRAGDVIVSRNATVGAAALVEKTVPFCMGQDVSLVRPYVELDSVFLNWLFRSDLLAVQIRLASIGSTFFRINVEQIEELSILLPNLEEQRLITSQLSQATTKTDAIHSATKCTLALLRERRSALIASVVTGQIPVGE